jgi:hypothetical protein
MRYKNFNASAGKIEAGKCGATVKANMDKIRLDTVLLEKEIDNE